MDTKQAKLRDCIAEWLRTTRAKGWQVCDDPGGDPWIQFGFDLESLPHYAISENRLLVEVCCPLDDIYWKLDANNPEFFELLSKKMEIDEARCGKRT